MRTLFKIVGLLQFVLATGILSAQVILEKNAEHVIYYSIDGSKIRFCAEDLNDNENNIQDAGGTSGRNTYCGKNFDVYEGHTSYVHSNGDILNNQWDECVFEIEIYKEGEFRSFGAKGQWMSSKYSSFPHPVWTFETLLTDLLVNDRLRIKVRVFLSRVARNPSILINYTTFYYPNQSCYCEGDSRRHKPTSNSVYYTLDFLSSTDPAIEGVRESFKKSLDNEERINLMGNVYQNLVTFEYNRNATTYEPKFSGVYVRLSDGRYIEIPDNKFMYGAFYCSDNGLITKLGYFSENKVPVFYYDEFKQVSKLRIDKTAFVEFVVNASGEDLSKNLKYLTLHPVREKKLRPVTNCTLYVLENEYVKDKTEQTVFYFDAQIPVKIYASSNGVYRYTVPGGLQEGLYGFWLGNAVWIIEIK